MDSTIGVQTQIERTRKTLYVICHDQHDDERSYIATALMCVCEYIYTFWFGDNRSERGKEKRKEERERISVSHKQNGSHFFMLLERESSNVELTF
jgi:hypothetical protein